MITLKLKRDVFKTLFTFSLFFCFINSALFADNNQTLKPSAPVRNEFNLPAASNNVNPLKKNIIDWENLSKSQGVDESLVGSTQDYARKAYGKQAINVDLSKITNNYLQSAQEYNNSAVKNSLTAYTSELQSTIMGQATSGNIGAAGTNKEIKCYITRDIPFRYKCSLTGLTYGGGMNESGAKAKTLCTSECYETKTCLNVSPTTTAPITLNIPNITSALDGNTTIGTSTVATDNTRKIKNIAFTTESDNINEPFYLTISYKDAKDVERKLVSDLRIGALSEERLFSINDIAKSLSFKMYTKSGVSANAKITNIIVTYISSEKWICPTLQDISKQNPKDFAKLCPSGKIYTFTKGSVYKICADGTTIGENADGTFATETSCLSSCKSAGTCSADTSTFNTEILKNFREGCIQGQGNCIDANCVLARKTGANVMNEVFFDAGQKPVITVQNSVQVKDVKRPRVSVVDDENYLKLQAEEWKDEAYANMLKEKTFNLASVKIGENTVTKSAFGIGSNSGGTYGVSGTSVRSLKWNFKPAAYDVSSGQNFYLYSVMVADIGHQETNLYGKPRTQRDRIWYIKTSSADQYKPFRREIDIGESGIDNNATGGVSFYKYNYVTVDYQTFSGSNWFSISGSTNAEYFETASFNPDLKPFWTKDVVVNLGNVIENLPGLMRQRTKDIFKQPIYDGKFDGSGDGLLDLRIIPFYSKTVLSYQQIVDAISNKTYMPIYQSTAQYLYPTKVESDAQNDINSNIHIYQYGPSDKQTAYMRAFPRSQDVGKKGFVYVFIY